MLIFTLLNKKMNKNIKYTNNPNNKAKSRIIFDSKEVSSDKDSLSQEGLYFNFKIDKIVDTQYHMLIVGPNDSPYSGGYYMFDCQFPDLYPFFPMKIISKTQGGDIRKHPNLYKNGKCCFSFLGTWSGPPWTACHNPKTVANRDSMANPHSFDEFISYAQTRKTKDL